MTDTSLLPFSPLTHHELNDRVDQLRDEAGGYALAVVRCGYDFTGTHLARLQGIADEHRAYQTAALGRAGSSDTRVRPAAG